MICQNCGEEFLPGSNRQKFCRECSNAIRREQQLRWLEVHRREKVTKCQKCGKNLYYKTNAPKFCVDCAREVHRQQSRACRLRKGA